MNGLVWSVFHCFMINGIHWPLDKSNTNAPFRAIDVSHSWDEPLLRSTDPCGCHEHPLTRTSWSHTRENSCIICAVNSRHVVMSGTPVDQDVVAGVHGQLLMLSCISRAVRNGILSNIRHNAWYKDSCHPSSLVNQFNPLGLVNWSLLQ